MAPSEASRAETAAPMPRPPPVTGARACLSFLPTNLAQMAVAAAEQLVVGVAHRVGLAAAQHHLDIHRFQAAARTGVDDAGRARYAVPRAETARDPVAALVLDENVEKALQDEEDFLDLVGVRGVALPRFDEHDRQGEVPRGNDGRIVVLAGAAGADEAVLRPLEAFDLGVLEGRP